MYGFIYENALEGKNIFIQLECTNKPDCYKICEILFILWSKYPHLLLKYTKNWRLDFPHFKFNWGSWKVHFKSFTIIIIIIIVIIVY